MSCDVFWASVIAGAVMAALSLEGGKDGEFGKAGDLGHRVHSDVSRARRMTESKACHAPFQAGHPVASGFDSVSTAAR